MPLPMCCSATKTTILALFDREIEAETNSEWPNETRIVYLTQSKELVATVDEINWETHSTE